MGWPSGWYCNNDDVCDVHNLDLWFLYGVLMSDMEIFIGCFEKAQDQSLIRLDFDEFYDLEEKHGCYYVGIDGVLFKVWSIVKNLDPSGFAEAIGPQDGPILVLCWYNGGASIHKVAEEAISKYLKREL